MSDHLPECYWAKFACKRETGHWSDSRGAYEWCGSCQFPCICRNLRACEQRLTEGWCKAVCANSNYEAGLDAARDAVEALHSDRTPIRAGFRRAIAAIDALRDSGNRANEAAQRNSSPSHTDHCCDHGCQGCEEFKEDK